MKKRNGFVSNSSSSSFIVTDARGGYDTLNYTGYEYNVGEKGVVEFGWGPEEVSDINSRINFCYLQSIYLKNKYHDMLDAVIRANTHNGLTINILLSNDYKEDEKIQGYIDHQSCGNEGENIEMFNNDDTLKDFIFGSGSYIHIDNDNY